MLLSSKKINSVEFKNFLNKGRKKSSKYFKVSIVNDKKYRYSKYAVVINKKIAKTAVLRHKNKRIIFRIISQIYPQFLDNKYTFIFIKQDVGSVNKEELKRDLLVLLG